MPWERSRRELSRAHVQTFPPVRLNSPQVRSALLAGKKKRYIKSFSDHSLFAAFISGLFLIFFKKPNPSCCLPFGRKGFCELFKIPLNFIILAIKNSLLKRPDDNPYLKPLFLLPSSSILKPLIETDAYVNFC